MSSIFAETMQKAISKYRQLLRKFLPQTERLAKLQELDLKNAQMYTNELWLYETGRKIVADVQNNLRPDNQGYYAYSGVEKFAGFLKEFLDNYEVEEDQVIHRAQIASRAMVKAIQLITLPRENLTEDVEKELTALNHIIANYGSKDQKELHKTALQNTLRRQQEENINFYKSILCNFKEQTQYQEAQE